MSSEEIALMAHLMRRAGFGATREELEERVANGYEATVEELLHPETQEPVDILDLYRYQPWTFKPDTIYGMGHTSWTYRMINTRAPLQEKMTLFWHGIFATGVSKVDHWDEITDMIDMFREKGMGSFSELLIEVAKSPAMIYWLDNNENHADAVNENWGRELLELFSMGVGNYTEEDVRECSRAFTGWTIAPKLPRFPMGRFDWSFEYRDEDHDHGEKTFLGHTGRFNGEDIVEIICRQPATARFVCRHLYSFFVADEPQVPAWSVTPPRDPDAIETLSTELIDSNYDIRSVLKVLFNSDFFKTALYARVKSPAEVVVGTLRLVGGAEFPAPGIGNLLKQTAYMGQDLAQSALCRGVALRHRVDKQRGHHAADQLLRGPRERCVPARSPLHNRPGVGLRRAGAAGIRGHVPRPDGAIGRGRADQGQPGGPRGARRPPPLGIAERHRIVHQKDG